MKYRLFTLAAALLLFSFSAFADGDGGGRTENDGVVTDKSVAPSGQGEKGDYILTLETYVTGEMVTTTTTTRIPADIVLVLDVSGSMDDSFGTISHTNDWRPYNQSWSYDDVTGSTKYYYQFEGNYYQVKGVTNKKSGYDHRTWLYFDAGTRRFYLKGESVIEAQDQSKPTYDGSSGTIPKDLNGNNIDPIQDGFWSTSTNVWKGTLYYQSSWTENIDKIDALKLAVTNFVNMVEEDAIQHNVDHRISLVKFADNSWYNNNEADITEGDHIHQGGLFSSTYNYTEVVKQLTDVKTGKSSILTALNGLDPVGATAADYGLIKTKYVLGSIPSDRQSSRVVVMFTDGEPNHDSGFTSSVANAATAAAYTLKHDYNATIYTVGVFTSSVDTNTYKYMNAVSSNYPDVTTYSSCATTVSGKFMTASDASGLSSVFQSISESISTGGASITVSETSIVLDRITNSFQIPSDVNVSDIKTYTSKATINSSGEVTGWGTLTPVNSVSVNKYIDDEGLWCVTVTGYDFSEHWVGKGNESKAEKLVLKIPIEVKEDAVGGNHIDTNTTDSGIYLPDPDDPTKPGETIEEYEPPYVNLPVNIQIKKSGLDPGDSATFIIYKKTSSDGTTTINNSSFDGTYVKYTTVILTGKSDGTPAIVKLIGLDPSIYLIQEGDWSYAYEVTNVTGNIFTTEGVDVNPFEFSNVRKKDNQDTAEAIAHNVFEKTTTTN